MVIDQIETKKSLRIQTIHHESESESDVTYDIG